MASVSLYSIECPASSSFCYYCVTIYLLCFKLSNSYSCFSNIKCSFCYGTVFVGFVSTKVTPLYKDGVVARICVLYNWFVSRCLQRRSTSGLTCRWQYMAGVVMVNITPQCLHSLRR